MKRVPMTRFALMLVFAAALAALAFTLMSPRRANSTESPPAEPSVAVETVPLVQQTLTDTVGGFGTVTTTEESVADVSFLHAGQITRLHVRPGQTVRPGDPLAELTADPSTLLSYEKARTTLEFAQRDLLRTRTLLDQHLATNAQLAAAQKAVDDAQAALATERKLGDDQRTEIARATFAGYVVSLAVAPGDRPAPNATVLKLARSGQVARILLGVEPEDARRVKPGMPSEVAPVFGPDQRFKGTVQSVSGSINPTSRRVDLWIDVPGPAEALVPGTSVTVRIAVAEQTGLVVPRASVLHDDKGDYVFQIVNGKARRVDVRAGLTTDRLTEVSGPLDAALKVVSLGNYELQDGGAVRERAVSVDAPAARQP
jgi:membrane fusion protein, multidrug efflux system